ncbi:hypothetical protein L1987_50623 [Smallanthus sonchifolius]|uniref:Uncharacterized protein n=1 Tax=Smallanthus sonchifolius TaxID=185202 RepID=A0ACB9END9_9ASTR|nr:hypothetical protein L1987_50623 [Smallanthus sonchifolius]
MMLHADLNNRPYPVLIRLITRLLIDTGDPLLPIHLEPYFAPSIPNFAAALNIFILIFKIQASASTSTDRYVTLQSDSNLIILLHLLIFFLFFFLYVFPNRNRTKSLYLSSPTGFPNRMKSITIVLDEVEVGRLPFCSRAY